MPTRVKPGCTVTRRRVSTVPIDDAKSAGFEASLEKIAAALGQPAGTKTMGEVMQKIGRARQRYARAAQHYKVHAVADDSGQQVTAVTWECFS